jgi:hypothetical protein
MKSQSCKTGVIEYSSPFDTFAKVILGMVKWIQDMLVLMAFSAI